MGLATSRAILKKAAEASRAEDGESSIIVSFSGGKDSVVVLDLCAQHFDRVSAFFMYLVPDLECVEGPLQFAERKYGIKIQRLPHFGCAANLKFGVAGIHRNGPAHDVRVLKYRDIERYAKAQACTSWAAAGQRATDSLERRAMLHKCDGYDESSQRIYPIWDWKDRDVWAYIRAKRLPHPKSIMPGRKNGDGVNLQPDTLLAIKEHWPRDFERICEFYPLAEASIYRERFRKDWDAAAGARGQADAVPEAHDRALVSEPDQERPVQPEGD